MATALITLVGISLVLAARYLMVKLLQASEDLKAKLAREQAAQQPLSWDERCRITRENREQAQREGRGW